MVGCWSINSSTISPSSSRSLRSCQSKPDCMTTVTHSFGSPRTTVTGFSRPVLTLTAFEVRRYFIVFRSRFLRVVLPTRGGPVKRHLRDLCLIFLGDYIFQVNMHVSWYSTSIFCADKIQSNPTVYYSAYYTE